MRKIKRVVIRALNHEGAEGLREYWEYKQRLVESLKKIERQIKSERFTDSELPVISWKFRVSMGAEHREDLLASIRQTLKGMTEGVHYEVELHERE